MIWFVVANTNSCRIFNYHKKDKTLALVKNLEDPLARLKGSDLISDRPGRYSATSGASGAYVGAIDPKENEIESFSHEIAKEIDNGRRTNQYNELIIAAQPHMSGLINKHLNGVLKDVKVNNVVKDYTHLKEHELLEVLKEL